MWAAIAGAAVTSLLAGAGWLWRDRKRRRDQAAERRQFERKSERAALERELKALERFDRLLDASGESFRWQLDLSKRLLTRLRERLPAEVAGGGGYEETFRRLHPRLEPEELELFQLIRGSTLGSMHATNTRLQEWLEANPELVADLSQVESLARKLDQLARHLREWTDKYASVFVDDETRSLVFLADEKDHGTPFPRGIEAEVRSAIEVRRARLREAGSD